MVNEQQTINLDNYVTDPTGNSIIEWTHVPVFSTCVDFIPSTRITNGKVTLKHIKATSCQETITFTAIGTKSRRASDEIKIRVG